MKTVKYSISFSSIDTDLSTEIIISKKEYLRQWDFLWEQISKTKENEYPMEHYHTKHETEKTIFLRDSFTVGTGTVYLTQCTCKPGYHFK
jgi:hypothetical protein